MADVFLTVILPIFLVAGAGAALQKWRRITIGSLSPITLYLLSPALIIHVLTTTELDTTVSLKVVVVSSMMIFVGILVSIPISKMLRQPRQLQSGFLLATSFPNAGNMGLPIILLAFGEAGLAVAVLVSITIGILSWSTGLFIAARGTAYGLAPVWQLLKMPVVYAPLVAITIRWFGWTLPSTIATPIELMAAAAIPSLLIILGFQMAQGIDLSRWPSLITAVVIRLLVIAPIIFLLTNVLGIDGIAQKVVIVVASMPTGVFTVIIATEFNSESRFVTSAVVLSTLCSFGTLTILIPTLNMWI